VELLECNRVSKRFGGLIALNDLSFSINKGQIFGLVGPNGSGKSTWINVATGYLKPTSGAILFKGLSLGNLRPQQVARLGLARTFQLTSTFANLTARENIIAASYLKTRHSIGGSFVRSLFMTRGYRREEARLRGKADEILAILGFDQRADTIAALLPTADQRKLEIAIALACEPEVLLLDEPAAGMNPEETGRLMTEIQSLQGRGITLLIVEHNMRVIAGICDHVVVINSGAKIAEGTPAVVFNDETVISSYLGEALF
jgi:branched-chain amino acid transport system ATP-binding protein